MLIIAILLTYFSEYPLAFQVTINNNNNENVL